MIRKIIIGPDYKNSMVHSVGQKAFYDMDHGGDMRIDTILHNDKSGMIEVWVINEECEVQLWKEVPSAFCTKEHDLTI